MKCPWKNLRFSDPNSVSEIILHNSRLRILEHSLEEFIGRPSLTDSALEMVKSSTNSVVCGDSVLHDRLPTGKNMFECRPN